MEAWGLRHDPEARTLAVAPVLPTAGITTTGSFRAGRTVLQLALRPHRAAVTLRVTVTFGPPIRLSARLADPAWAGAVAEIDGVPMGRAEVAFEASASHEVIWRQ